MPTKGCVQSLTDSFLPTEPGTLFLTDSGRWHNAIAPYIIQQLAEFK